MENAVVENGNVLIIFSNFLCMYGRYLSMRKKRIVYKYIMRNLSSRSTIQCCNGYQSRIFTAVVEKNDDIIKKHLRIVSSTLYKIADILPGKYSGWSRMFDVTVFLFWLGCGASYRVTAESFQISRYTVRNIVHNILDKFMKLLPSVIKYPSEETFEEIANGLNRKARTTIFSNALGAIDGTHIKVLVPTRFRDQYINRKLDTTIQLQAVCNSAGEFVSICVGYPGSVHDQRVLRNSKLYKDHKFPPYGYYLLGDNGYACRMRPISIITPFKRDRQLSNEETRFNEVHSKARSIIERTFGMLKTRWRATFDRPLQLSLKRSIQAIAVSCIAHNLCVNDAYDFLEIIDENLEENGVEDEVMNNEDEAIQFRRSLVERLRQQ